MDRLQSKQQVPRKTFTRRPWTQAEKSAVAEFFERQRYTCETLGKKEFDACIAANPVLKGRSWRNVKDHFYNTFKRK